MHTLLNQELAQQHRTDLEREAAMAALAAQVCPSDHAHLWGPVVSKRWYDRISFLHRRPAAQSEPGLENISLAEIRRAVLTTFHTLHEEGLVSDYDDRFIETFVETFQGELAHHAECACR